MIHTVTFNPCLDYIVRLDDLRLGEVNRVTYENILPGGKGINVSIVLKNLGHENRALGFVAGFTGAEIAARLEDHGVTADFIEVTEANRVFWSGDEESYDQLRAFKLKGVPDNAEAYQRIYEME